MELKHVLVVGVSAVLLLIGGCAHYYKVSDPAGTKEYYTTEIETAKSGAIKIEDAKSGSTVTLQSSEVKEITKEEFEAAVKPQETQN